MKCFKRFVAVMLFFIILADKSGMVVQAVEAGNNSPLVIALDPGHGGEEEGAMYYGLMEKDINYQMAQLVKQQLEKYPNVTVVLTREEEETLPLYERANRALAADADILLSLHFNASVSHLSKGASVYVTTAEAYREKLRQFADCLLGEFEAIGLENAGTFARVTQMGGRRTDGTFDDYYGILRHSYNNGMPSMIIEHCYMDAEDDKPFFYTEEGLQKLAKADANAIAAYYELVDSDGQTVTPKHAQQFGATTKALEKNYYEPPNVTAIKLIDYDGMVPGLATFEVGIEDGVGITSVYLVYKNVETEETMTVYLTQPDTLTTGSHRIKALIPVGVATGEYRLVYIGAYNAAGYDAGYNFSAGEMVGFGKCDWLNTFAYRGEASLNIMGKGKILDTYTDMLNYEIEIGKREQHTIWPVPLHADVVRIR
ncbi:MAG: N-acetylmuramoyl-L-alanine amidase [Clostridium sp.]|nr:N-acetylmuramoyl-L-alanine amidase [Clostridium sp.]